MKRSFRHWTPLYLVNRLRDKWYRWLHPDQPWLTPAAIAFLKRSLKPEDVGLEFGSGRSTLWLARRLRALTSVEHDPVWYEQVRQMIQHQHITNITYLYRPLEASLVQGQRPAYVQVADTFASESLDFVLIDGRYRDECALAVLDKLRPGGMLVLDNADVYLPSRMKTPNARSLDQGTSTPAWGRFLQITACWPVTWTTNGVFSTAIFFKR